ncbi:MAG: hypothetical protein J6U24_00635 [Paludibacteraceae bacterium]|nr:hypothetical protein [Paludibacteraceae bacterium]
MSKDAKISLLGLTLTELQHIVAEAGLPRFTAAQIASWLYEKRVCSFDDMTNISKKGRETLDHLFETGRTAPVKSQRSTDVTVIYIFSVGV